jgi:hypothetical protein
MAILKYHNKVEFDPSNREHLVAYKKFLDHRNADGVQSVAWAGCPFDVEHPYMDAVTCINAKIAQHFLKGI